MIIRKTDFECFIFSLCVLLCTIFKNGNLNLLYFYAIVFAIPLLIRNMKFTKEVLSFFVPFALMVFLVHLFNGYSSQFEKTLITTAKMFLCMLLMCYIKTKVYKINCRKLLKIMTGLFVLLMVLSFIFWNSNLFWTLNDTINGFSLRRLHLLFLEPSILGQFCGIMCIIIFSASMEKKLSYANAYLLLYVLGMILSFSLSGIVFVAAGVGSIVVFVSLKGKKRSQQLRALGLILLGIALLIILLSTNNPVGNRIHAVLGGVDASFEYRWTKSIDSLGTIMDRTHYLGVGLGNMSSEKTGLILDMFGIGTRFSNSFLYLIGEMGIVGLVLILTITIICIKSIKKDGYTLEKIGLLVFITLFQIAGGYFTDPFIWIVYGLILSTDTENNRARLRCAG